MEKVVALAASEGVQIVEKRKTKVTRALLAVLLVALWAACSAVVAFLSLFSWNNRTIGTSVAVAVACLLAALVSFAKQRDPLAFAFAAAPGVILFFL
jgi:asparagine N-glycosylation enzyme membrane subunit Stt3